MKLWGKGYGIAEAVESFTVGNDRVLDITLAKYDVQASIAHAEMLHQVGILTAHENSKIIRVLEDILQTIENGHFVIEESFEDVHSKIEYILTEKLGKVGKKIHTGRSRNDQILVDLHLFAKAEIKSLKNLIRAFFDRLIGLSMQYQHIIIPGYTHLQVAMPSSFGLWFGAYAESLVDDLYLLRAAYRITDQNPLGSAAGYGTSMPLKRQITTELLGFETLKYNVVAAQMSRGKLERSLAFALASVANTLSKMAMDICLYMSQNFDFLSFPDELTTGSSIMPHKKNPDVFELVRARCNKIQALPNELILITNNLPSGYHRDYQLLKETLLPAIDSLKSCLEISEFMMGHIIIKEGIVDDKKYRYLYSVEAVNRQVMQGLPFRDAYRKVSESITAGTYQPDKNIYHTHEGSMGNLCLGEIQKKFNLAFNF